MGEGPIVNLGLDSAHHLASIPLQVQTCIHGAYIFVDAPPCLPDATLMLNDASVYSLSTQSKDKTECHSLSPPGPDREVDNAARFIQGEFLERNLTKSKIIYPHFTTATDTSNIKVVMKVVLDTIIRENLEAANLL